LSPSARSNHAAARRRNAIPKREIATLTGWLNCWRIEAADSAVAARA
jgi:ribosome modulation factor